MIRYVDFVEGTLALYKASPNKYSDKIYFVTDAPIIYLNNREYGISEENLTLFEGVKKISYDDVTNTFSITKFDKSVSSITLPLASELINGLMSISDYVKVNTTLPTAIADEQKRAEAAEKVLTDNLNKEIEERKSEVVKLNVTAADLSITVNQTTSGTTIKVHIKDGEKNLKLDSTNGLYTDIKLNKLITPESGENVYEEYELLSSDNTRLGTTIKVYKDRSLDSVTYTNTNDKSVAGQYLKFVYNLANGKQETIYVDMSELIHESEYADGLQVVNHVISVKRDSSSESFLTISGNGIKVSGVQTAIDAAKNEVQSNLNKEIDRAKEVETTVDGKINTHKEDTTVHITADERSKWTNKLDVIPDLATIKSNASNGKTAYDWGNHADAGYLQSTDAANTYVKKSGDTMTGRLTFGEHYIERNQAAFLGIGTNNDEYLFFFGHGEFRPRNTNNNQVIFGGTNARWANIYSVLGNFSGQITSSVATGTAPFSITSTTKVDNLNADMVDGKHDGEFTAAKLAKSVTIWGQSFDGTGNVSGALTDVSEINYTGSSAIKNDNQGNIVLQTNDVNKYFWIGRNGTFPIFSVNSGTNNVGIKTINPTEALDVNGNVKATSFIKSGSSNDYVLLGGGDHKLLSDITVDVSSNINSHFGFKSRATTMSWGAAGGSVLSAFTTSGGGALGFKDNMPESGLMSAFIDGYWYLLNGQYRCLDSSDVVNSAPTLAWNTTSTIGSIGGVNLQVKLPANPNVDTKVTSVDNHYTPSSETYTPTTGSAVGWSGAVITGITKDSKGHITGVTTGTIPANPVSSTTVTGSGLTANAIVVGNGSSTVKSSGTTIATTIGTDDTTLPTSKAVKDFVESKGYTSNTGTVTGVKINGATKNPSSGVVDLGDVITSLPAGSITGTPGASKTFTAFSQSNGKVTATVGDISITKSQVSDLGTIGAAAAKGVDTSISAGSTSTNLPTSKAVADLVSNKADKSTTVSAIDYDSDNKKITKTINGSTTDIVDAATIVEDGGGLPVISTAVDVDDIPFTSTAIHSYVTEGGVSSNTGPIIALYHRTIATLSSIQSQLRFKSGNIYFREIPLVTSGTLPWKKLAFTSDLENYLPLSGGTITGDLELQDTSLKIGWNSPSNNTMSSTPFSIYGLAKQVYTNVWNSQCVINASFTKCLDLECVRVTETSDINLKDIVEENKYLEVDLIANAPSISFRYKDFPIKTNVGTIAQYWEEVLPEAVDKDEQGHLTLHYGGLSMISVISLAREIVLLKEYIKTLEDRIKVLENLIKNK